MILKTPKNPKQSSTALAVGEARKTIKMHLSGHGQYSTEYHICWATKYHHPTLTPEIRRCLNKLLPKILETMPGCKIVEIKILKHHVHILMIIPPKYAVKDVIGRLKGMSAGKLKERFRFGESVWSPGYFVKTVGVPEKKIIEYIRNQKQGSLSHLPMPKE